MHRNIYTVNIAIKFYIFPFDPNRYTIYKSTHTQFFFRSIEFNSLLFCWIRTTLCFVFFCLSMNIQHSRAYIHIIIFTYMCYVYLFLVLLFLLLYSMNWRLMCVHYTFGWIRKNIGQKMTMTERRQQKKQKQNERKYGDNSNGELARNWQMKRSRNIYRKRRWWNGAHRFYYTSR